jgi:hypothetical protein
VETRIINIIKILFIIIGGVIFAGAFLVLDLGAKLIMLFLGGIFFTIGAGIVLYEKVQAKKETELRQTGRLVQAKFAEVKINQAVNVNGRCPYQIEAHWLDASTNQLHIFNSSNLWYDPSEFVANKSTIPVYVDPSKPSRYYMDISFLPKVAS